jgi:hypothetical protein
MRKWMKSSWSRIHIFPIVAKLYKKARVRTFLKALQIQTLSKPLHLQSLIPSPSPKRRRELSKTSCSHHLPLPPPPPKGRGLVLTRFPDGNHPLHYRGEGLQFLREIFID